MNRHYAKGRRLEYKTMRLLEGQGYTCLRTAGSHGDWDILAFVATDEGTTFYVRLIQVKANRKPTRQEIVKMQTFPAPESWKEIWIWSDRRHDPQVLALSTFQR